MPARWFVRTDSFISNLATGKRDVGMFLEIKGKLLIESLCNNGCEIKIYGQLLNDSIFCIL